MSDFLSDFHHVLWSSVDILVGSVCTKFEVYIVWAGHSDIGIARSPQ